MDTEKPRVMQVVASLALGGAERVAISLASGLQRYGWNTTLCSMAGSPEASQIKQPLWQDAQSENLNLVGLPLQNIWDRPSRKAVCDYLRSEKIDLVHVHNRPVDWQMVALARYVGVKVLFTRHMVQRDMTMSLKLLYRIAAFGVPKVVTVSQVVADYLREVESVPKHKIQVIYNGVRTADFLPGTAEEKSSIRKSLGVEKEDVVLLCAVRLHEQKGLPYLIRAAAMIPESSRIKILLAGDGPERDKLHKLAKDLGTGARLQFLGRRSDIPELLKACDGYLCSSLAEGHPISLLEAMSAGVPIIAPRLAVIREVMDPDVAVLFGPDHGEWASGHEPKDIADGMLELESNTELREDIGQRARDFVLERYSMDAMLGQHDQLYRSILDGLI